MNAFCWTVYIAMPSFAIYNAGSVHGYTLEEFLRRAEHLDDRVRQQQAEIDTVQRENINLVNELQRLREKCQRDLDSSDPNKDQHVQEWTHVLEEKPIHNTTTDMKTSKSQERATTTKFKQMEKQEINRKLGSMPKIERRIRQTQQGLPIAFFAMASNHVEHLGQGQPVIFDHVVTNIGQAYHQYTGIFTAPVSGLYMFLTTLRLTQSEWAHFHITVNGRNFGNMYGHESTLFPSLGFSAVVQLSIGDDVAIRCHNIDKSVFGEDYSSFSGFLLAQD